jgi:hypothetical protein
MDERLAPGTNHCLCDSCGQYFGGVTTFDLHRVGEYSDGTRRCLTAAEMQARGLSLNARGLWVRAYGSPAESESAA